MEKKNASERGFQRYYKQFANGSGKAKQMAAKPKGSRGAKVTFAAPSQPRPAFPSTGTLQITNHKSMFKSYTKCKTIYLYIF
jgi:hypothetical protein